MFIGATQSGPASRSIGSSPGAYVTAPGTSRTSSSSERNLTTGDGVAPIGSQSSLTTVKANEATVSYRQRTIDARQSAPPHKMAQPAVTFIVLDPSYVTYAPGDAANDSFPQPATIVDGGGLVESATPAFPTPKSLSTPGGSGGYEQPSVSG